MKAIIYQCTQPCAWYEPNPLQGRRLPIEVDVVPSGTKGDYRIVGGDHDGKHVAIADCSVIALEATG